jgi:hypothetical protein
MLTDISGERIASTFTAEKLAKQPAGKVTLLLHPEDGRYTFLLNVCEVPDYEVSYTRRHKEALGKKLLRIIVI